MLTIPAPLPLLLFFLPSPASSLRARLSYQTFFPDVSFELTNAVANNCSDLFDAYIAEDVVIYSTYCVKTYSCIMNVVTEYTKANMASSSVLLGLTPVVLATLGSSTTELALLSSHRPLLALLLVLGSPAVNPIRTFDYHNPQNDLQTKKWQWDFPERALPPPSSSAMSRFRRRRRQARDRTRSPKWNIVRVAVELFGAVGSIGNLAQLCYTTALNTIAVMSCDFSDVIVMLWIVLALVTHGLGVITFKTRAKIVHHSSKTEVRSIWGRIRQWLQGEFSLCVTHTTYELKWQPIETRPFIVWSFFGSVYTMVHLIFGILVLSSLSFVGIPDAVMIVGRFMASAIVCRIIVAYELAGMTAAHHERQANTPIPLVGLLP